MIDDGGTLRLIGAIVQQHPTFAPGLGWDRGQLYFVITR
jgi:hypothetical protein